MRAVHAALLWVNAVAACPDSSWRSNAATGKCYKIAKGYVAHGDCAASCGSAGSLACIKDVQDELFLHNWMQTEGIPGTPRTNVWIGSYYQNGWSQCAGGQASSFANWTAAEPVYDGTDYSDPTRAVRRDRFQQGECALFDMTGWYARDCLHWYHCLCEAGVGTSAAYQAWHASRVGVWMAPWTTRGVWTFVVGGVVGILPGLVVFIRHLFTKPASDWNTRVRSRVQATMLSLGWLTLSVGFAPIIAFFVGVHAVYAIGYPQGYAALVPPGLTCWVLAVIPTNESATRKALVAAVGVYGFFGLVGLLAIVFWGVLSFWISGIVMGLIFLVTGVLLAVMAGRDLSKTKARDAQAMLRRVWQCSRAFFAVLFVVSIWLLIEYVAFLHSQFSENLGWILLAISSLLFSAVTRPAWRVRFCVWLSGVGVKVQDRAEAMGAARLIWIELHEDNPVVTPTASA